jgi:polysaccharide lyase-like protein
LGPMQNPRLINILINVAGVVVGLFVIGYIVYAALQKQVEQTCSAHYPAPTRFSLETQDGKPLSPIQLQARAGRQEVGVLDNASVVAVDGAPEPRALEVKLRDAQSGEEQGLRTATGIAFRWSPPGIAGATSACLTYSLWLPDRFAFAGGGVLPGPIGSKGPAVAPQAPAADTLSMRPEWLGEGNLALAAVVEGGDLRRISRGNFALPTGRWSKVEQEIVLNTPGQPNGLARLWIDGNLIIENKQIPWRKDAATTLTGVLASAGYKAAAPQPGVLRLSPLEVSWK